MGSLENLGVAAMEKDLEIARALETRNDERLKFLQGCVAGSDEERIPDLFWTTDCAAGTTTCILAVIRSPKVKKVLTIGSDFP